MNGQGVITEKMGAANEKMQGQASEIDSNREDTSEIREEIHVEASVPSGSNSEESVSHTEEPGQPQGSLTEASTGRRTRRSAAVAALAAIHQGKEASFADNSESEDKDFSDEYQVDSDDTTSEEEVNARCVRYAAQHHAATKYERLLSRAAVLDDRKGSLCPTSQQNSNTCSTLECRPVHETFSHKGRLIHLSNNLHSDGFVSGITSQFPNHTAYCEKRTGRQNTNQKSVIVLQVNDKSGSVRNAIYFYKGKSILKPLPKGDTQELVRNTLKNTKHLEHPEKTTQENAIDKRWKSPMTLEFNCRNQEESADLHEITALRSMQSRMIICSKNRTDERMKLESNELDQKLVKQKDYQLSRLNSNNCKLSNDVLNSGKIIVHPTSGLLVVQICLIDGNQNNSYNNVQYKCLKCPDIFSSDVYSETHSAPVNGKQIFTCHVCGDKMLHHYQLSVHLRKHSTRSHFCPVCKSQLSSKKGLKLHMATVHSTNKPHACQKCSKTFKTVASLRSHMNTHIDVRQFECKICGESFKFSSGLRKHHGTHPDHPDHKFSTRICHVCGKTMKKGSWRRHLLGHSSEQPEKCNICGKVFANKGYLNEHVKRHNSRKSVRHICEVCGKGLPSPSGLKDHMNIHSGLKPYVCPVCGKKFAAKFRLQTHSKSHSEKKLKCDTCGYICNRMDNLVTHLRSHTGEKPYICSICGKNCSRKDNLSTHVRNVHGIDYIPK